MPSETQTRSAVICCGSCSGCGACDTCDLYCRMAPQSCCQSARTVVQTPSPELEVPCRMASHQVSGPTEAVLPQPCLPGNAVSSKLDVRSGLLVAASGARIACRVRIVTQRCCCNILCGHRLADRWQIAGTSQHSASQHTIGRRSPLRDNYSHQQTAQHNSHKHS